MPRKHVFFVVVLLGATAVAGLFALTRTISLGQPANASTGGYPAISFRLKRLDRLEASLERQVARAARTPGAPVTVYRRAPALQSGGHTSSGEYEGGYEAEGRDD